MSFGLFAPALQPQHGAQRSERLGIVGLKRKCPAIAGGGLLKSLQIEQYVAQVAVGRGVIGFEVERLAETAQRVVQLPEIAQRNAEIVVRLGKIRPDRQRAAITER